MFLAAKLLGSEEAKCDLDAKMQRREDAKNHSLLRLRKFDLNKKFFNILSLVKRNILISPLEGEKKFLSEFCELRNFREGYDLKYSCPVQHETVLEPSPAFVMLTGVRKRLLPLTKREGCDSVISSDFKSKISITNENNLSCKELSALVPQYLRNFSETVFSRFTSHFSHKCTAFTLAEVLITLGIIGIVAVLTIPVLYSKYQQKVTETRFERVYSDLTKAFNAGAIENGEEYFMQSWQMSYNDYIEYVYQNYLKPHIRMMDVVTFGGLEKKYNAKNPQKVFWTWSQHIFIIDKRTFISFDSDGKTILVVLLNNDNFDFSNIKDGVNLFSLGTPFCCNNDKCASLSSCPNHNLKPISAWTNYPTEKLVEFCKEGKDIAWQGGKRGFCTQALIQNGFKFPKGYPFK